MKEERKLLIELLQMAFGDESISVCEPLSDERIEALLQFASFHSLVPIVCDTLLSKGLTKESEISPALEQLLFDSILIYQKQTAVLSEVNAIFEENGVDHIPLKGSVLRKYYKEPWLRTSCDIDILIHEEDLERATELLTLHGFTYDGKSACDVSFYKEDQVHVELHYRVISEETDVANAYRVLSGIWDFAVLKEGKCREYVLTDEMFYFYHIAHMAKHIANGGCGMRPFLDLWVLKQSVSYDEVKKQELLEQGGLLKVAQTAEELAGAWFLGKEYTEMAKQLEWYIFAGGVYGTLENQVAMRQVKLGGKLQNAWSKIFLKYDIIKYHYPILEKHKWLLPYFEVVRWLKLIFKKEHRDRSLMHLSMNQNLSGKLQTNAKTLREYFHL